MNIIERQTWSLDKNPDLRSYWKHKGEKYEIRIHIDEFYHFQSYAYLRKWDGNQWRVFYEKPWTQLFNEKGSLDMHILEGFMTTALFKLTEE